MQTTELNRTATRRRFLRGALAGIAALAVTPRPAFPQKKEAAGYQAFKMGLQSYSLRTYPLDAALEQTRRLGLRYWEAWDRHLPVTESPEGREKYRKTLRDAGVTVIAYGVVSFGVDQDRARRLFTFARAMGIETLTADPTPEALEYLGAMAEEFGVNVAIHNHGPGSRYDTIDAVWNAMQGRSRRIGACVDTGHFLRSDQDPVEAIRRFGDRLYSVHLKDVTAEKRFTELGKGTLKLAALLKSLEELRYRHLLALEYEENPKNPMPGVEESLTAVRAALKS